MLGAVVALLAVAMVRLRRSWMSRNWSRSTEALSGETIKLPEGGTITKLGTWEDSTHVTGVGHVVLPSLVVHGVGDVGQPAPQPQAHIVRSPGYQLSRMAEFLFSKRTHTRVLQPIIADLQAEYIEALDQDRQWKAAWVRLRGYLACAIAVVRITGASALLRGVW